MKTEDLSEVLKAVGRKVTVYGIVKYAKAKVLPASIDVDSFIVEPDDTLLPNLLDARGLLRDALTQPDSEAWRNEWWK